jgi:hypothetical protein
MPENSSGFLNQADQIVKYLVASLVGIITWITNRLFNKVDVIEKTYVSMDTLNNTIDRMDGNIKGIHERLDKFIDKR